MALLNDADIQSKLTTLPDWQRDGNAITKTYKFKNFVEAIAFDNRIVEPAESANHHPDLEVSYGKVVVTLRTHDAGGLTEKDFDLAQAIAAVA